MKRHSFLILSGLLLGLLGLAACSQPTLPLPSLPASAEGSLDSAGAEAEFVALVNSIAPAQWTIGDYVVGITAETVIDGTFAVGDTVKAHVRVDDAGLITALRIEAPGDQGADDGAASADDSKDSSQGVDEFVGVVESIAADAWTVSGQVFGVTPETEIKGEILVGDSVKVHARPAEDGSLIATEIELAAADASGDDSSSGDDASGSELEFTGLVESLDPGQWVVSGKQFAVTPETEIKGLIALGDLVKVHALVGADGSLTAREIELAEVQDQANPGEVEFTGTVDALLENGWVIGGQTVLQTPQTEVKGDIQVGDQVKVEGSLNADGTFSAREVSKLLAGDDSGSGSNGSDDDISDGSGHGSDDGSSNSGGSDDSADHDSGDDSGGGGGGGSDDD